MKPLTTQNTLLTAGLFLAVLDLLLVTLPPPFADHVLHELTFGLALLSMACIVWAIFRGDK